MATLYPIVRLVIDPKIEVLLPTKSVEKSDKRGRPKKPEAKKCFVCETPKTEKSEVKEFQKEQAELLKLMVVKSDNRQLTPLNQFNVEGDVTCDTCNSAMDAVWKLHKEMVSVIRQIDEVVKKVADSMEQQGENQTKNDPGQSSSSVQTGPIVDVSSSMEHFKKLEVNQVGADGSEKTVATRLTPGLRTINTEVSSKSPNVAKTEGQNATNNEPIRKSTRVRCEIKSSQRFGHDVWQKIPKSIKTPLKTQPPPLACLTNKKTNSGAQIDKNRRQCSRCNTFFRSFAFLQRHIRSNICENKKYRKKVYKPKEKESDFIITAKDFPHKCPNSNCEQSFMKGDHLAEHLVQCGKGVCLSCYESVPRNELVRHMASCRKSV